MGTTTGQITLEGICADTRRRDEERLRKLAAEHRELEKREPDFTACAMLSSYRERLVELAKQYGHRCADVETSLALGRFIAAKLGKPRVPELLPSDIVSLLETLS